MNIYSILADALSTFHLAYVSYVVLGQLAIMIGWLAGWRWIRNPWFRVSHLTMILIVAVEAYYDITCPLTTWEFDLRVLAGQVPDDSVVEANLSFVGRLVRSLFLFSGCEDFLTKCYYVFAGLVLATAILVPPRFRRGVIERRTENPVPAQPDRH